MKNLGASSLQQLKEIGIETLEELMSKESTEVFFES